MKKTKPIKRTDNLSEIKKEIRDQFTVVLEKIKDEIQIVAEGQIGLRGELADKFNSVKDELKRLDSRFELLKIETRNRLDIISGKLESSDRENKESHKSIADYLFRLEQKLLDLKEKLGVSGGDKRSKGHVSMETRMLNFEKELEKVKIALKLKTA